MNISIRPLIILTAGLALAAWSPTARAQIYLRVSVKLILDSSNQRPTAANTYNYSTPERIRAEFADYNGLLDRMGWGFRLDLTEVVELSGVSQWFNVDARDGTNRTELEVQAKLHPIQYAYRPNAINVYVNNQSSGVSGGHLPLIGDVIFVGANGYWTLILHEVGHALGLCHTHGCFCNDNCMNVSDNIADTVKDSDQWKSLDAVAIGNFNAAYASLNSNQRRQVDDVWQNIMSYHEHDTTNLVTRLTHDQWERMVDVSNLEKRNVATGWTLFVDGGNQCLRPEDLAEPFRTLAGYVPGWSWGTRNGLGVTLDPRNPPPGAPALPCPPVVPCSLTVCLGGPFKQVGAAVNNANAGDRLQIKAGHYNEPVTINKHLTLATDRGLVVIGAP